MDLVFVLDKSPEVAGPWEERANEHKISQNKDGYHTKKISYLLTLLCRVSGSVLRLWLHWRMQGWGVVGRRIPWFPFLSFKRSFHKD